MLVTARFLLLLFFATGVCWCQNAALSLASGSGAPGSTVSLDLTFRSGALPVSGLQWTLSYWTVDVAAIQVLPGPAATSAGKSIWCAGGAGSYTCLVVGINTNSIGDGVVGKVTLQLSPSTPDLMSAIGLTNQLAASADGSAVPVEATGGVVSIQQPARLSGLECTPADVVTPGSATCTLVLSAPAPAGGLQVTLSSPNSNLTLPASVTVAAGATTAGFNITASRVDTTVTAQVRASVQSTTLVTTVVLAAPGNAVWLAAVVNAASYQEGAVAPGEIVTIFGSGLGPAEGVGMQVVSGRVAQMLAGTRVLFDGVAAPLLYVRSDIVNAVAPYSIAGRKSTLLQIEYQGTSSKAMTLSVADTSPGIFAMDASGAGQGAILNQDTSINSEARPAPAGSIIVIYATGEGRTQPAAVDGGITLAGTRTIALVAVLAGGLKAEVLYAGAAPGLIAGVLQVNARLPAGLATGPRVPVSLVIGGVSSQPGITVAVQ